jgi:chromosome partitioning protein
MKEVITIISRKGGTGKTTTAQALGAALRNKGARVLLIDLDAQRNLTASMGAKMAGLNVTHLLEESGAAAQVIQHTENGDIITGSPFLAGADIAMTSDKELKRAIAPLLPEYDYIIIDTPANYGKLTRNALAAATSAIITAHAATFSLQGLSELIAIVDQIKTINDRLKLRGVIVANYGGRSNKVKQMLDDIRTAAAEMGAGVIEPPIRSTDKVIEAQAAKINLIDYAPRSTAAQGYIEIADKIYKW